MYNLYAIFAKYLDICKQFAGNLVNERNNINAVITPLKQCLNAVLIGIRDTSFWTLKCIEKNIPLFF